MNIDRVLQLADFLDTLPRKYWNFAYVTKPYSDDDDFIFALEHFGEDCGAVGCAIGWCPAVFEELRWELGEVQYKEKKRLPFSDSLSDSFATVADLLGMTRDEVMVFSRSPRYWMGYTSSDEITPDLVATKLRQLVAAQLSSPDSGDENV